MKSPIQTVVILGGSSAGLLAAVTLKRYFPHLSVTLLHTRRHPPIGVGESTTAWVPQFLHHCLGIAQQDFYKAVWPVWKLGIRFEWGDPATSHFNYTFDRQFSDETTGLNHPPGRYCMHDMQQASRFSVLMDKLHAPLWLNQQNQLTWVNQGFGYHLGIQEFTTFLWQKVKELGVAVHEIEVLDAVLTSQGDITALRCEHETSFTADLWLDCSGFQSQLLGKTLEEPFISFSHRLFCDAAVTGYWQRPAPIFPFTTVTTMNSGWRWRIDLRDRVSFGYVYSSQFCSEEDAIQEYLSLVPHAAEQLRTIRFRSGRYRRFWVNNVVAIGNAGGFVEPLESTGQHMIAETLWRLVLALQDSDCCPSPELMAVTNQYLGNLWDEICDFLTLHFKFNRRLSTPFWRHCQAETDLGNAQELVDFYQACGVCRTIAHLVPKSSLFEVDGYLSILCGQKLPIKTLSPLTQGQLQAWNNYRQGLQQAVERSFSPQQAFALLENQLFKSSDEKNS